MDPLLKIGGIVRNARLAARTPKLAQSWADIEGGKQLSTRPLVEQEGIRPNNVQVIYQTNPAVQHEFDRMAGMNTKQVMTQWPMLKGIAPAIGRAKTGQEVANAFEMALTARNYSFAHYGLPHTSLTRRLLGVAGIDAPTKYALSQKLINGITVNANDPLWKKAIAFSRYQTDSEGNVMFHKAVDGAPTNIPLATPTGFGKVVNAVTNYQPFAFHSETLKLSGKRGDPADPEFLRGLYSTLRYSQNAATSKAIVARFADAPTLGEKINILKHGYADALRASGLPDTSPFYTKTLGDLDFFLKQTQAGIYGLDKDGRIIRMVDDDGNPISQGLVAGQTGQVAFPDFNEWRRAVTEQNGKLWAKLMKVDDFLYRHVTAQFFKRLVLLSLGFAFRVSSGEVIPAIFSQDARRVFGAGFQAASAKLNPAVGIDDLFGDVEHGVAGDHPLVGTRAATSGIRHIGTVTSVDPDTREAQILYQGQSQPITAPLSKVTFYHGDLQDEELKEAADELGVKVTPAEVNHFRAAFGSAMYGVGRALVDSDYRQMALMNILAFDGHVVAPGLASVHEDARGIQGINHEVRKAALKAGINAPRGAGLSRVFRQWSNGDQMFPLFWKYTLDEYAGDPGIRAMAREYSKQAGFANEHEASVLGNLDLEDLMDQIEHNGGGITYDLKAGERKTSGYAFASHPEHEQRFSPDEYTAASVFKYLKEKAPYLSQDGHHLGVWTTEDGTKVFDVSRVEKSLSKAKRLASKRGEEAIADLGEIERNGVESPAAFHNLSYDSEAERQRIRDAFAARNPVGQGAVRGRPEGVLRGHGEDATGSGAGAEGERPGVPEATRVLSPEHERAATEAAIKADRLWMESDDPVAQQLRFAFAHYSRDPERFSALRAEAMKGLVMGQNGSLNLDVLDAMARGETPGLHELAEKEIAHRPISVKGRELKATPVLGTIDQVIAKGWDGLHAVINSLSRAPIYTMFVTDEYKMLKPWVEAGYMTKAEAHSISTVRALDRTLPLIHNTLLRSQASLAFRNVFPFYFAQEQAYKRYGRAMFSNPVAFRKAQIMLHGLHSSGALQKDPSTGQTYFVYPGAGDAPQFATWALGLMGVTPMGGIPASVTGDTISLRSVVPEAVGPGVGPVVAVPLKAMADQFPHGDPVIRSFLGTFGGPASANSTLFDEVIPNTTLRRVIEATPLADKQRSFTSTYAYIAAYELHKAMPIWAQAEKADPRATDMSVPRNQLNPEAQKLLAKADRIFALPNADPHDKQVSIERIRNATRVMLLYKAAFGFLSPLSPQVTPGDVKLHNDLQFESSTPVLALETYSHFLYCSGATMLDGTVGTYRLDLGFQTSFNRFAYAKDYRTHYTGTITSMTFLGSSGRLVVGVANTFGNFDGRLVNADTAFLAEPAGGELEPTGFLQTGNIRFHTQEPKLFKYFRLHDDRSAGSITVSVTDEFGSTTSIITMTSATPGGDVAFPTSLGPQEWVSVTFTLARDEDTTVTGPSFFSYQVKALPGQKNQRLIVVPIKFFDHEKDKYGNRAGYEGYAWQRLQELETLEEARDNILFQDMTRAGQSTELVVIGDITFQQTDPPANMDGFGGTAVVTLRTVT